MSFITGIEMKQKESKSLLITKIMSNLDKVDVATLKQVIKITCQHQSLMMPSEKDIKDEIGSVSCADCGSSIGWYCPDSKDHLCHYFSEEDPKNLGTHFVVLNDKIRVDLAKDHDPHYETDDSCLFCGAPDERK